jgi:hypothetical protein
MKESHENVGYDDWYIKKRQIAGKDLPRLDSIEPHHGREIGLMKAGLKPCAIIHLHNWSDLWVNICNLNGWLYVVDHDFLDVYIATVDEGWRIDALMVNRAYAKLTESWSDMNITVEGRLLGYSKEEINVFLAYIKLPKTERYRLVQDRWK